MKINLGNLTPALEDMNAFETTVLVIGEAHSEEHEVDMVRRRVINFGPDAILHELYLEEEAFYKKNIPSAKILPLETKEVDKSKSLKVQFQSREENMIDNIKKQISDKTVKLLVVVVGDAHLRTVATEEFGDPTLTNYLNSIVNIVIIRSGHSEIK